MENLLAVNGFLILILLNKAMCSAQDLKLSKLVQM